MMAIQFWKFILPGAGEGGAIGVIPFPDDWDASRDIGYLRSVTFTYESDAGGFAIFATVLPADDITSPRVFEAIDVPGNASPWRQDISNPWVIAEGYFSYFWNGDESCRVIFEVDVVSSATNADLGLVTFGNAIFEKAVTTVS